MVGVNRFESDAASNVQTLRIDPAVEQSQIERVRAVREKRDATKAEATLTRIEQAASGTENLLPRILEAVEAYVTVGEISNRLRKVWGEYREALTV